MIGIESAPTEKAGLAPAFSFVWGTNDFSSPKFLLIKCVTA
jgi:hypothetical protein